MVSTQLITPATFTPWVEQERNRFTDPRGLTAANFTTSNATLVQVPGGGIGFTALVNSPTSSRLNWAANGVRLPTSPGEQVQLSTDITAPGVRGATISILFYDAANAYIAGSIVSSPLTLSGARATVTGTAPAGTVTAAFQFAAGGTYLIGETFLFDRIRYGSVGGTYVDGNEGGTATIRASWLGLANASISTREVRTQLSADVYAPVYEVVKLTSATDEITFYATPDANGLGFVYDNETLERWYRLPKIDAKVNKRPNAHGAYGLGQIFAAEARPLLSGQYFGANSADAKAMRNRLSAMFSDGYPVTMSVTDEAGMTESREVSVLDFSAPFAADFSHVNFDLELVATDPRRYGAGSVTSAGMPTASSGLVWPLGTSGTGKYFDWGTPGSSGQVSFTNTGGAATLPRIEVGGAGTIGDGFRITEIETGRELTYTRTVDSGQVIVLDSRTQRATLNGGDVTAALSKRQWFEIPRGATRRYQITPLGPVTGAPLITIYTAPANL